MSNRIIVSFLTGVKRRWRLALTQAFALAGAVWLVTEILTGSITAADDWLTANGAAYLCFVFVTSAACFLAYSYEPRNVVFRVPTTDSHIKIEFGNIFDDESSWLIGVNEYFDGRLGQVISKSSVHGQFITKVFDADENRFRTAVESALHDKAYEKFERIDLPNKAYAIGTCALIPNGRHKAFLVAMSQTDLNTHKAKSDVPMLWQAMEGGLTAIHHHGNGAPLSMPLIGNGLSNINIEPQHLLRLIVLKLVDFGRKVGLPKEVKIILPPSSFEQLDIREIKRDWKKR